MQDNSINEFMDSDAWKKYEKKERGKRKFVKTGKNVVHLEYLRHLLSEKDISDFEAKLNDVDLELSSYDKTGTFYAYLDEFQLTVYLLITQPLIGELIKGISTNATWDAIKYILISTWKKIKNQSYVKRTSQTSENKEVSFGLQVQLDKNTSFNLKLEGDIEESIIETSLDKVLNFISNQNPNKNYKNTDFGYFDRTGNEWVKIDVDNEIRKRAKSKNKGNKKNKDN